MREYYSIATGTSRTQKRYKNESLSFIALIEKLKRVKRTEETVAEFKAMTKDQRSALKDVGGFVGGFLKDGSRKQVVRRSLLCLDVDFPDKDFIENFKTVLDGHSFILYSTHSFMPERPRYRIIIPLARDVSPEEYEAIGRMFASYLGIDLFDHTTFDPGRMMFWASCPKDGEYVFDSANTEPIDPDAILKDYGEDDAWEDTTLWPVGEAAEKQRLKTEKKLMQDPNQKRGIVGAFIKAYPIHEAIATFAPDYKRSDVDPRRYTYTKGTTANGVVIYDDKFAYSHHATDPISGQEVNAFDFVRKVKFGELDEDVKPDTPVVKLPSYKAMSELVINDEKAKVYLVAEQINSDVTNDFENEEGTEDAEPAEGGSEAKDGAEKSSKGSKKEPEEIDPKTQAWYSKMDFGEGGRILSNAKNIETILMNDSLLAGKFGYDEFKYMEAARCDLPWRKITKMTNALMDSDDAELRIYLSKKYKITGERIIHDGLTSAARKKKNRFHPVRDYLKSLKWDGKPRLETLLIDYFGVEDTPYVRTVTKKTFLGAVYRVFEPGCKFDTVLVLKGPQGCGKSTFFRIMAKGWFSDSLKDIKTKDALDSLKGVWIIEIGEFAALRKADSDDIKRFVSQQIDLYRPAYGRRTEEYPRQCIFVATTNEPGVLRDYTGNRRFLPVEIPKNAEPKLSVFDELEFNVDQIWAEAYDTYLKKEIEPYLTEEEAKDAIKAQEMFLQDDPRRGQIMDYLEKRIPTDWYEMDLADRQSWMRDHISEKDFNEDGSLIDPDTMLRDRTCAAEIWMEILDHSDTKDMKRGDVLDINRIVDGLPNWQRNSKVMKFKGLGTQRGFIRINKEENNKDSSNINKDETEEG